MARSAWKRSTDDVERGHTIHVDGVVHIGILEDSGDDREGGIDRVEDDEDVGLGETPPAPAAGRSRTIEA